MVVWSVSNQDAARTLFGVASLLESQGANPYRVRAYRRAAVSLMRMEIPAEQLFYLKESARSLCGREPKIDLAGRGSYRWRGALFCGKPTRRARRRLA